MGINYSKCINLANKLQSMSYEYQGLYNSVMSLTDNSSSYWQGEANQAFREEIEAWRKEAISIKNEMEDLAYLIKKVSKQVKNEETKNSKKV